MPTNQQIKTWLVDKYDSIPSYLKCKIDEAIVGKRALRDEECKDILKILIADYIEGEPTIINWIDKNVIFTIKLFLNLIVLGIISYTIYTVLVVEIYIFKFIAQNLIHEKIIVLIIIVVAIILFIVIGIGMMYSCKLICKFIFNNIKDLDEYTQEESSAIKQYDRKLKRYNKYYKENKKIIIKQFWRMMA